MITIEQLKLALQLMRSLDVYRDRKEFDGSLKSAIECLELAGYEIEYSHRFERTK